MSKFRSSETDYCLHCETHPKYTFRNLCALMEHQSLVDVAICCGSNTIHAHKCVLAAASPYFREELEKNSKIEQIIVGFDIEVMKSVVEFIYCGETTVTDEHLKYVIAAAKLFQLRGLEMFYVERPEFDNTADEVQILPPQFLTKKPKYPSAPLSLNNTHVSSNKVLKSMNYLSEVYNQKRLQRKYIKTEADKACAKEAQASRMALANLQKEIAETPQVNSFIIEESCTETTVENFFPNTEELENSNDIHQVQVVDYSPTKNAPETDTKAVNFLQFTQSNGNGIQGLTTDKIKQMLSNGKQSDNVEIMYKASDGKFTSVTDDVLKNFEKSGYQYQVVNEHGELGEVHELVVLDRNSLEKITEAPPTKIRIHIDSSIGSNHFKTPTTAIHEGISSIDISKRNTAEYISSEFLPAASHDNVNRNGVISKDNIKTEFFEDKNNIIPISFKRTDSSDVPEFENSFTVGNVTFSSHDTCDEPALSGKPLEFVEIDDGNEFMCSVVADNPLTNPSLSASNYYNFTGNIITEDNCVAHPGPVNSNGRSEENQSVREALVSVNKSSPKTKPALKFSPDIFFADLPVAQAPLAPSQQN